MINKKVYYSKFKPTLNRCANLKCNVNITANICHELKNSLTVLRGFIQLLMQGNMDSNRYQNTFNILLSELDRASSLTKGCMDLDDFKPSKPELQDLNGIIENLYPILKIRATQKNLVLKTELESIPEVNIVSEDIRQLIINLAFNGMEAMDTMGVLTIKTYSEQDAVVLMIQDQGSGIPPQVLNNLGNPYITTKENGTGLGLSNCIRIISEHKAAYHIETGTNGTKFYVKFKQLVC